MITAEQTEQEICGRKNDLWFLEVGSEPETRWESYLVKKSAEALVLIVVLTLLASTFSAHRVLFYDGINL